jgi:hypothetical protein
MDREEGKGSLKHRTYQRLLADCFRRKAILTEIEGFIGKNVDVLVIDAGKTIAIEIQLTPKHCLQIEKDYELGCDEVWVVCESDKVSEKIKMKIRNELSKSLFEKTKFYLIKDFLPQKNNKNNRMKRNRIEEENNGIKRKEAICKK